jgi:hypothetical protein
MTQAEKQKLDTAILFASFAVALAFRLIRLGHTTLNDYEAELALQALGAARGSEPQFGSHAAYVGLTGISFFLFSASNFLARFWPAIVGSLIVFVPVLFRKHIGRWPATVLAFVLAISPEMVGLSRLIGSPMMAMVFLLLALGFFFQQKPILTGLSLALGIMSGQGFWIGVFILGIGVMIAEWLFDVSDIFVLPPLEDKKVYWLRLGLSFAVALVIIGTGLFLFPANLSGVFSGLIDFIRGFITPKTTPFILMPLTLIAYPGAVVIFGLWGSLRAILIKEKVDLFLLFWWLFGCFFLFLFPAGEPAHMIWVTLPLWVLSARVVTSAWRFPESSRSIVLGTGLLVVAVSAFILFAVRSLLNQGVGQNGTLNTFLALIVGVVLLIGVVLLVSYGWSEEVALSGLLIGLAVVCCAGLISVSVNSTGLAPEPSQELWYPEQAALSPEWVMVSIDRVHEWNALRETPLEIAVSGFDTPGMRWVLRDEDPVYYVDYLPASSQPDILITDIQQIPEISSGYRGQDLVWSTQARWEQMLPFEYLNWLITRDAPTVSQQVILWVRTDLMPDEHVAP